jgi:hypothetical protein
VPGAARRRDTSGPVGERRGPRHQAGRCVACWPHDGLPVGVPASAPPTDEARGPPRTEPGGGPRCSWQAEELKGYDGPSEVRVEEASCEAGTRMWSS